MTFDSGANLAPVVTGSITLFFETTLTSERIAAAEASGGWSNELLYERFTSHLPAKQDDALVVDLNGTMTWGEASKAIDQLSRGLLELGVRRGDVVQVQLPNRREFLLSVLAVERIGAAVNPVAPIFRHNELTVMSELAQPSVVITTDDYRGFDLSAMHLELVEQCPWVNHVVVAPTQPGDSVAADAWSWDAVLEAGEKSDWTDQALGLLRPSPNDVCEVIFTSGTTGQPKGVMHTQNTINVAADVWLERVAPGCVVFHMASTLAHQTGYLYGIRAPISAGGQVIFQEVWDGAEFARLIEQHRIQATMGATPFLSDLLNAQSVEQADLSSFRSFVCAGAAIPLPLLEQAKSELPCTVLPGWGMTETGLSTIGDPGDEFEKLTTDGSIVEGNEVRVVNDAGSPVDSGVEGDLQFRGTEAFVGYIQGRELTDSCWRDGWFDTGDRATIDSDGYLKISGRTKDIVIRGGENIPVKEVEDVLLRHPMVGNVAVVGLPHERLGEIGCAVVLTDGDQDPTLKDLTDFLNEYKVTRQFWPERLEIVDEFPMTPSGKVQKYKLRQRLG